ncbi:MAG: MGH1-like glycoside hydrolase domain-containing protein, partial [Anaerolineae bacterium]
GTLSLWDQEDGFYYDVLKFSDGHHLPVKVRSIVGIIPLFAVTTISLETLDSFPGFRKRLEWFLENRVDLCGKVACMRTPGQNQKRLLSIVNRDRLRLVLQKMLSVDEFLSPYGIRSLSKYHQDHPYTLRLNNHEYRIDYEPAESTTKLFGGNSNWRGPVWFPLNMLIIESLQKFHHYFGDDFKVECPTGSGQMMNLWDVSLEISKRLIHLFLLDKEGKRPIYGGTELFQTDPEWRDKILFYEYFHGDNGAGIGASHQTGWTGLVAKLIRQLASYKVEI